MKREFGFKRSTVEIMAITMASLGFALGQLFIPPMSEVFSRLLTSLPAASCMSTGGGTVADLMSKEERCVAVAIFTAGPLFGPVL
ncbi:hypothetical protein EDB80DRAFT_881969 [Ilyonectria destructans]|nr:hypothetical protein EDB80DRAFT_881969 [Ilyonectria destructans]